MYDLIKRMIVVVVATLALQVGSVGAQTLSDIEGFTGDQDSAIAFAAQIVAANPGDLDAVVSAVLSQFPDAAVPLATRLTASNPAAAVQIATTVARRAPASATEVAGAVAAEAPDQAVGIAVAVASDHPDVAAEVVAEVAVASGTEVTAIAPAVANAVGVDANELADAAEAIQDQDDAVDTDVDESELASGG